MYDSTFTPRVTIFDRDVTRADLVKLAEGGSVEFTMTLRDEAGAVVFAASTDQADHISKDARGVPVLTTFRFWAEDGGCVLVTLLEDGSFTHPLGSDRPAFYFTPADQVKRRQLRTIPTNLN